MSYEWEAAYRDERNKLIDGEQEYGKSYDRYLLMLSGGALALSITFVHDIIGDGPVRDPFLIISAWIAFTLSVTAALVSIHQSGPLFRDFRNILDRNAHHAGDRFLWTCVREEQAKCRRLWVMDGLNYTSLVLFVLGVILLLSFAAFNLEGASSMSEDKQQETRKVVGGTKPALGPVDRNLSPFRPGHVEEAGKPPLAPVDVAPPNPGPAEPAPTQPTPAQPAPSPSAPSGPTGGDD